MLNAVEHLLVLQDRDRQLTQLQEELDTIAPQRAGAQARGNAARALLETSKLKAKMLEADRKKLELEVETRKQLIEKYSLQQFQTKRNEEYRALAHEIDGCKAEITGFEDQQLEIMEQAETAHRVTASAKEQSDSGQREIEKLLADLASREQSLKQRLAELRQERARLAAQVDPSMLARYERIRKTKGGSVVAGVEHGACGGCHVGLPAQIIIGCRSGRELTQCPNCGRILFYTRDMDMVRSD